MAASLVAAATASCDCTLLVTAAVCGGGGGGDGGAQSRVGGGGGVPRAVAAIEWGAVRSACRALRRAGALRVAAAAAGASMAAAGAGAREEGARGTSLGPDAALVALWLLLAAGAPCGDRGCGAGLPDSDRARLAAALLAHAGSRGDGLATARPGGPHRLRRVLLAARALLRTADGACGACGADARLAPPASHDGAGTVFWATLWGALGPRLPDVLRGLTALLLAATPGVTRCGDVAADEALGGGGAAAVDEAARARDISARALLECLHALCASRGPGGERAAALLVEGGAAALALRFAASAGLCEYVGASGSPVVAAIAAAAVAASGWNAAPRDAPPPLLVVEGAGVPESGGGPEGAGVPEEPSSSGGEAPGPAVRGVVAGHSARALRLCVPSSPPPLRDVAPPHPATLSRRRCATTLALLMLLSELSGPRGERVREVLVRHRAAAMLEPALVCPFAPAVYLVLRLLKAMVRYLGLGWRRRSMEVVSAIHRHVPTEHRDRWLLCEPAGGATPAESPSGGLAAALAASELFPVGAANEPLRDPFKRGAAADAAADTAADVEAAADAAVRAAAAAECARPDAAVATHPVAPPEGVDVSNYRAWLDEEFPRADGRRW